MKSLFILIFFLCQGSAYGLAGVSLSDSVSAYNILRKAIEVKGGSAFLKSIKTMYTNTITRMDGIEVNWVVKEMLPNKDASQLVSNNRILYQSWFDGKKGFEIVNGKKRRFYSDEIPEKLVKKNIISELDYVDSSLWKVSLAGQEIVMNQMCYKIHARSTNGIVKNLFYSKQSFLLLKEEKLMNAAQVFTLLYMSFERKGQLTFCNEMKLFENGKYRQVRILDMVINEKVLEDDFR